MAGLGGFVGSLATLLGVLGALGAFSRLPSALTYRFSEPGYVRFFDSQGHARVYWANLRHDIEARRWRVDYQDDRNRRHYLEVPLRGGAVGRPELLQWVNEPEVGVWDLTRQTVHNAVPLRWVVDLTESPYRMRLAVRYTSGKSGDGEVEIDDLLSPDPNAALLRQRNGDREAIPVRVYKEVDGQTRAVAGRVFMSAPVSFRERGEVQTRMRGLYRLGNRNYSFHVDYMEFVEAYTYTKHQREMVLTNGRRAITTAPELIIVDLTRGEPLVRVQFRDAHDRLFRVDVENVTCPVTVLKYANL